MALKPIVVASAVECSGDDSEVIGTESHDRKVAPEATTWCEQRRINRTTNRYINIVDAHVLQESDYARASEIEFIESSEVDHADRLAHLQVLGVCNRRPPSSIPLVWSRLTSRFELADQFFV